MERRQLIFFVFVAAVLAVWMALQAKFGPKPKPKPVAKQVEGNDDAPKSDDPGKVEPGDKEDAAPEEPSEPEPEESWLTAGSLEFPGPYRFLATFSTRGAALERVELANPKYDALDDLAGYLGELRLTLSETPGRMRINAVGAGTPARRARPISGASSEGLQPGDELVSIDNQSISEIIALYQAQLDKKFRPQRKIVAAEEEEAVRWFISRYKPGASVEIQVLRNGAEARYSAILSRRPLSIIQRERFSETALFDQSSFHLQLAAFNGKIAAENTRLAGLPDLSNAIWRPDVKETPEGTSVEFHYTLEESQTKALGGGKLEIIKRYFVPKVAEAAPALDRTYHLGFTIEVVNLGDKPVATAYRLEGPTGLPIEGWWYTTKTHPKLFYSAGARDVVFDIRGTGHRLVGCNEIVGNSQAAAAEGAAEGADRTILVSSSTAPDDRQAAYFGVDSLYFASVLIPKGLGLEQENKQQPRYPVLRAAAKTVSDLQAFPNKQWNRKANVTFELTSELITIQAGESWKTEYEIFLGPKSPELLSHYGVTKVLELGWFAMIARVLSAFLHLIHSIIPSYAIAILILTITVRCCVLPFSLKAAKGASVMQQLAPEMQKIKERYKDDPAKQGEAMKELWRKHNYNPLSGCLPVFLQIPIFVALYKALSTDIELRGVPLIPGLGWCRNLAGPDMLWHWQPYLWDVLGSEVGYLGPYFNLFPLITVALFLWQQMLFTPPATNDEMRMQQQMMKFMTIFMGVMFFKVPAGLCIYFITSSLWGICERLLLFPKPAAPAAAAVPQGDSNSHVIKEKRIKRDK